MANKYRSQVRRKVGQRPPPAPLQPLFDGPRWPAIMDPMQSTESLERTVAALKARAHIQSREKGDWLDSFVSIRDLMSMGILNVEGHTIPDRYEAWKDAQFPASKIALPGAASDPTRETTTGLLLFSAGATQTIYVFQQLPHSYIERSYSVPHVHWEKTDSTSGTVAWRCRYKRSKIGEVRDAAWTTLSTVTVPVIPDTDTAEQHLISSFGQLDMSDMQASDCVLFEISRVGGSDTYANNARLLSFDSHVQVDGYGSYKQFDKDRGY